MATLPSLRPNSDVLTSTNVVDASLSVPASYWAEVNDDPDSGAVGGLLQNLDDSFGVATIHLGLTDSPIDFLSMDSVTARLYIESINYTDDEGVLDVFIGHDTLGALTSTETAYDFAVDGNTSGVVDVPLTLTAAGQSASKTDWDGAYIGLTWTNTKNMASDDGKTRVYGVEVNGEFSQTPPTFFPSAAASLTVAGSATTFASCAVDSSASASATAFREQFAGGELAAAASTTSSAYAQAHGALSIDGQSTFEPTISPQTMFSSMSISAGADGSFEGFADRDYTYQGYDFGYVSFFDTLNGEATLEATATVVSSATVTPVEHGELLATATAELVVAVDVFTTDSPDLDASATMSAIPTVLTTGAVSMEDNATMSIMDLVLSTGQANLAGVAEIEITQEGLVVDAPSLFAESGLSAIPSVDSLALSDLSASATLSSAADVDAVASASITAVSNIAVYGQSYTTAMSSIAGESSVDVSSTVFSYLESDMVASSSLQSAGVVIKLGTAQLSSTASMDAKDDTTRTAEASLVATGEISVDYTSVHFVEISLTATSLFSVVIRQDVFAYSFFILPKEGESQLAFQGFNGDAIYTSAVDDEVFVEIGSHQSPALNPDYWYYVLLNDEDWTVEQLDEGEHDGLLMQNVGMFGAVLTTEQEDDLVSMATIGAIVRGVEDDSMTTITDGGATGIAANWHRRKIT